VTIAVIGPLLTLVWAVPFLAWAAADERAPTPRTEGAIGLVVRHSPVYPGSSQGRIRVAPGGFLRWRSLTLTGSGGFTTRTREVVEGGLAAELLKADGVRLRLGLSLDRGRRASDSPELAGLGDIEPTVRGRLSVSWWPHPAWQLSLQGSSDLLGRGGGLLVQGGLSRHWDVGPNDHVSAGLALTWADADHAAQRYGIDAAQSAASGRPVFEPGAGWQQAQAQIGWRGEFQMGGQPFGAFVSLSSGRLLGDTARSPLVQRPRTTGVSGGLVWRF
jgi:outer membrane scaffolding protein for murein synthesis (MipA/OmpV family)